MMFAKTLAISVALFGVALAAPANDPAGPQKMVHLAHSVDTFGLNLLNRLDKPRSQENVLISPLSISSVLSSLLAGSASATHQQIHRTLGYEHQHLSEQEILHNFAELRRGLNHQMKDTKNLLEVADAIALQKGYPVLESFLHELQDQTMMTTNFVTEAHKATEEINGWVKEKTHGKIAKLFEQDLTSDTVMVLLNAVYFKGAWKTSFDAKHTQKAVFTYQGREGKEAEQVDMMYKHGHFGFAHFDDGDLLEIPYKNDSVSFLVYLPNPAHLGEYGSVASVFNTFANRDSLTFSQRLAEIRHHTVNVHLPKFKIESTYSLKSTLSALGMGDAFVRGKADFSRINGKHDLVVSDVAHKATLTVDEVGSEASAATGIIIEATSAQKPVNFNANRPFLFMIYDKQYQLALFTGVVNKP